MLRTNSSIIIKQGRGVLYSALAGIIIYFVMTIILSYLIANGIVSEEYVYQYGALLSLVISSAVAAILGSVIFKARYAVSCAIAGTVIWIISGLLSVAIGETVNIKNIIISFIICEISSVIVSIPKNKKGKLHKRKHRK